MTDRRGVLLLLFDLPMQTAEQRREYRGFIKNLRRVGFSMFQESVYVRLLSNISAAPATAGKIERFAPKEGSVRLLPLSLQTFKAFQTLRGTPFDMAFFSDDFIVI